MAPSPVLTLDALKALDPAPVLIDCRVGPKARAQYEAGHLPGALFANLELDLAAPTSTPEHGGRHPLPPIEAFSATLGAWGIGQNSHVVLYDDQGGANAAARLWWMLRAVGHEHVQILDGGLQAALAHGMSLSTDVAAPTSSAPYPVSAYLWPTAEVEEVDRARQSTDRIVLDVRSATRFRGEQEPIDPVAGHIPGAQNVPFSENLDGGFFKSPAVLREQYSSLLGPVPVDSLIVHCGSGVTACHTLLALEHAGLRGAKLYVGSWSEWCRQSERPRAP